MRTGTKKICPVLKKQVILSFKNLWIVLYIVGKAPINLRFLCIKDESYERMKLCCVMFLRISRLVPLVNPPVTDGRIRYRLMRKIMELGNAQPPGR